MTLDTIMIVGRGVYALQLIRLIAKTFHGKIILATTSETDFTSKSKHVDEVFLLPKPMNHEEEYIQKLTRIVITYKPLVIFPVIEETFYLSKHKERFPPNSFIFNSDIKTLELLHNKYEFIKLLEKLNLPYPKTKLICYIDISDPMTESMAILKPIYSRGGLDNVIYKPGDIIDLDVTKYIIQEHLGSDTNENHYSTFAIVSTGNVLAICTYKCQFAINGFSSYRTHIKTPIEVEHMMKMVTKHIGYTGFIGFDLIKKNSVYYPLECNPRLTNGIGFMKELTIQLGTEINIRAVANDKYINRQSVFPAISYAINHKISLKKIINATDDIFSWSDIMPFFIFLFYFLYYVIEGTYLKIRGRISNVKDHLKQSLIGEIVTYAPRNKLFY